MAALNEIAVALMRHLCDHYWHGYAQDARYGDGEGSCPVEIDGRVYLLNQGDRDCSSAVTDCWQRALEDTLYEGALNGATYTGNMRSVFVSSGLFEWQPMSFTAQPGDIYLNEANHTAMCISAVPDLLGEFSINEHGGITGGQVGDQTGHESYIHEYYDYPWDGILHYVGSSVDVAPQAPTTSIEQPRYRVKTAEDGWLDWMVGTRDTSGSSDDYAGVQGHAIIDADFEMSTLGTNGWWQLTVDGGTELAKNTHNGTGKSVIGITVYYDTPENISGYHVAKYRVAPIGGDYYKWEIDDEDGGAGGEAPIDRFQLLIV